MRIDQDAERQSLQQQQRRFWARVRAIADVTGRTRRQRSEALQSLRDAHKADRQRLVLHWRDVRQQQVACIDDHRRAELRTMVQRRDMILADLKARQIGRAHV